MTVPVPRPISGGLILSYRCPASCRHCIYACSQKWSADWMSVQDVEAVLSQLAGKIVASPHGPKATSLNHGLHFTGGEPFVNFDLLCKAVEIAHALRIPSTFVETNCFWASDEKKTREMLKSLKSKGLRGIMISVNPFYLEYVPFERTERAVRVSLEVFGRNVMVYQLEYFRRFMDWGIRERVPLDEYLAHEQDRHFAENAEFLVMGRAPFALDHLLRHTISPRPAAEFLHAPCETPFLRSLHNHFDNYGNYMPGFCGGISFGDCRNLDRLLKEGVDPVEQPVLSYLMAGNFDGLFSFAGDRGFEESPDGYFSKCHFCMDLRRHLALNGEFNELNPKEFYRQLESNG